MEIPLPDPFVVEVEGASLACYRHVVDPNALTLIHFHGNGEIVSDYVPGFAAKARSVGLNLILAEYRGYGGSSGSPALVGMLEDGVAVMEAAELDPSRTVAFGRSVGSIYALHLAFRKPNLAGLVIESGIADPLERVLMRVSAAELGVTEEELAEAGRKDLDHKSKIEAFEGSTLVLHTRHDGLVDLEHAERLHAWAPEPKRLRVFEEGTHNSILAVNWKPYWEELEAFLAEDC